MNVTLFDCFRAWIAQQIQNFDASHDIVHVDNVVSHVRSIIKNENMENEIGNMCELTALAHEVCDKKYTSNFTEKINEMRLVLEKHGAEPNLVATIVNVVPRISFSRRLKEGDPLDLTKKELIVYRIVSDADMLEAMGATGVVRTYMFQAVHGHTTKGAWTHTTNTLFRCNDYLYTTWAKNEGEKRLVRMKRICEELENERTIK